MKATEVLNRYANGERDFRRANLRGQSFKGQELSNADFTEADIRGADFSNATLKGVNFTKANAGIIYHRVISIIIFCLFFAGLAMLLYPMSLGVLITIVFISLVFMFKMFLQGGFANQQSQEFAISHFLGWYGAEDWQDTYKYWRQQRNLVDFLFTLLTLFFHLLKIEVVIVCLLTIVRLSNIQVEAFVKSMPDYLKFIFVGVPSVFLMLPLLTSLLESSSQNSVESFFGAVNFQGADLTDSNFSQAILIKPKFYGSNCDRIFWYKVKNFGFSFIQDRHTISKVILKMKLLIEDEGINKNFDFMDLERTNLHGANLTGSSFVGTDFSDSYLQNVDLSGAVLKQAQLNGADLTGSILTGACLESWNIDHTTKLEGVECRYVYLLENQQERRPSSGDFAPGEFTKLFQEALNTVDLIFRNGVDWKAFVAAFQTVQVDNDGTELTIQSIENKGDGVVVVRVSVPETADKAKLHGEFNQNYDLALKALEAKYHAELKAKDEQITIYREKSADMTEILRLLANRPVTVEVNASAESKAMSDSTDKSQSVNIGGNVTGSTINLGAISGSVSNGVNQLPSAPDPTQPGIKELLIELQAAIESDADLPEKGKASALENVKVLAEVAQDPEQPEKKGLGSQAVTFLKGAASFLPDTAKLAEACTKLLPLITKALGLPF